MKHNKPLSAFLVLMLLTVLFLNSSEKAHKGWRLLITKWDYYPPFCDLRVVLKAVDFSRVHGSDVTPEWMAEVARVEGIVYNYPSAWLVLRGIPFINNANAVAIGSVLIGSFLAMQLMLFHNFAKKELFLAVACLGSPVVWLALERGNNDLVIFILIGAAVYSIFLLRGPRVGIGALLSIPILGLALAFKPYAVGAALAYIFGGVRRALIPVACLFCFGLIFAVSHWEDLKRVKEATPQSTTWSYGAGVMSQELFDSSLGRSGVLVKRMRARLGVLSQEGIAKTMSQVFAIGMIGAGISFGFFSKRMFSDLLAEPGIARTIPFFLGGVGTYLFTFCAFNNWIYRLIFLLFCLPLLLSCWSHRNEMLRTVVKCATVLTVFVFWFGLMSDTLTYFIVLQLCLWGLTLLLSVLCGAVAAQVLRADRTVSTPKPDAT